MSASVCKCVCVQVCVYKYVLASVYVCVIPSEHAPIDEFKRRPTIFIECIDLDMFITFSADKWAGLFCVCASVCVPQITWNLIFSILICAIFIRGPKSDTGQNFFAMRPQFVISKFQRLLCHSRSTFITILHWRESLC